MKTKFTKELYKKIFINCCLLRGFLTEKDQRLNINIRFKLEGHASHCHIDGLGNIHCRFSNRLMGFDGELIELIGKGATLSISKGSWGSTFTGTVELNYPSVDSFFWHFYLKSEQLETVLKTFTKNGVTREYVVQPLPFSNDDNLKHLIDNINNNETYLSSGEWEEISGNVFPHAKVIEKYTVQSECNCSREMFFGMLMSVDIDDLKQLIQTNRNEELECGICGKKYIFDKSDLESIIEIKGRG